MRQGLQFNEPRYIYNYSPLHLFGHLPCPRLLVQLIDLQNGGSFLFRLSTCAPSLSDRLHFSISSILKHAQCGHKYKFKSCYQENTCIIEFEYLVQQ